MKRRTTQFLAVALASTIALAGCSAAGSGDDGGGEDESYSIVFASPLTSDASWTRSGDLLAAWAEENGHTAKTVGPSDSVDIPRIVSDIQQAINEKADVIITCACQGGAFDAVLTQAREAGIIVVTLAGDSAPESRDLFLGTSYEALGQAAADAFIEKTGGTASILVVRQNGTVDNQVQELAAFKEAIADHPGMQIVGDVFSDSDAAKAQQVISQSLTTNPEIDAIWTLEGTTPGIIEPTLIALGKEPGEINVLGIDLSDASAQAIENGYIWATMYQQFFDATPLAAQCAIDIIEGGTPKSDMVDTGTLLITKDNIPETLPPPGEVLPTSC